MTLPKPEFEQHVRLIASMSVDWLCGKGCTDKAYIMNLRMIADALEGVPPNLPPNLPPIEPTDNSQAGRHWRDYY